VPGARFFTDVPGQSWQIDAERRPVADFAIDIDPALMLLDDAEDGRQPQAGAFADGPLVVKNGSKIFGRISGGMPQPVSLTLKRTNEPGRAWTDCPTASSSSSTPAFR
jgi:hypothetical protein